MKTNKLTFVVDKKNDIDIYWYTLRLIAALHYRFDHAIYLALAHVTTRFKGDICD